MSIEMKKHGSYETFETANHHTILVLDNHDYYAWINTSQGHLLVQSDSDHRKAKTLLHGDYVLFTPHDEPELQDDVDHLELREGQHYNEYILPNGLPSEQDKQKKLIDADEHPDAAKIDRLLKNS